MLDAVLYNTYFYHVRRIIILQTGGQRGYCKYHYCLSYVWVAGGAIWQML